MSALNTRPNIARPDDFYAALIALHEGRSKDESDAINARLIFILANQIGDGAVLREALVAAAESAHETVT
jgi:hypothetical protein